MELEPIDPKSKLGQEIMMIHGQSKNLPPASQGGGMMQLEPVDPKSKVGMEVLKMATEQVQDIGAKHEAGRAQLDQPPPQGRVDEVEKQIIANRPPLFMEKHGLPRPPGVETIEKYAPMAVNMAMQFTPGGRAIKGAVGAGGSVVQDLMEGRTPSVSGAMVGGLGGLFSPELATAGKFVLRNAGRIFGSGPLKKAAGTIYDETKALTKPVTTQKTEQEILKQSATFGRTAQPPQVKEVTDLFDSITAAKNSGQPLTYGEVFNRATQLNQAVDDLFTAHGGRFKEAAGQLKNLSAKMMEDLAASGPEAAKAVETYKKAIGLFGGPGGVMKAIRNATGLGIGISTAATAAFKPVTMAGSVPAAIVGGIINLSERLPFGVGQGIARALITDPKNMSKGAVMALTQAVNEQVKEY